MDTKKIKPAGHRVAPRNEKLIRVPPEVHRALKVQAAQKGKSIGKWVGQLAEEFAG